MMSLSFGLPAPLRRASFRQLWLGMTTSYAGDRLQGLAQAWLVATITGSALGVGLISASASIPLLLTPVGGVIVDRLDRRRLLIVGQLAGGASTAIVAALVVTHLVAVWHIYLWAFVNGIITIVSRPAYKVVLTEAVPMAEVRSAVALNSTTETSSLVLVNGLGSLLIGALGLPIAFLVNVASYLVAALCLVGLGGVIPARPVAEPLSGSAILTDLVDGGRFLWRRPELRDPLLLTMATVATAGPLFGILPAIVHNRGGSIVDLGLLAAALSVGSLVGAIFGGARGEGDRPARRYALYGLAVAGSVVVFVALPLGVGSALPLAIFGFALFSEAVWNTSRVRRLAEPSYQARLQSLTSMAFTLGLTISSLWSGALVDRLGLGALLGGALTLGLLSLWIVGADWRLRRAQSGPIAREA
jgi:predicted MFS family arabinose efflux permease